ncbi:MAG: nucleotidyltransferase [Bacteroidota bacterium]|nr:nucleotidyltransferase [Bacteroidota bacterium]
MDIFDEEVFTFLKSLQNNNVQYIMVGGYAANLHGFQRFTWDMDLWLKDTKTNRENLRKAFAQTGMGDYFMIETMQFIPGWTDFKLNNGMKLDIMVNMKGLESFTFDECMGVATIADIDGIKVPVLHINQLIANKKAVDRPKDQIDVIELEKIKELRKEKGLE